jgi:hypothetical protein
MGADPNSFALSMLYSVTSDFMVFLDLCISKK